MTDYALQNVVFYNYDGRDSHYYSPKDLVAAYPGDYDSSFEVWVDEHFGKITTRNTDDHYKIGLSHISNALNEEPIADLQLAVYLRHKGTDDELYSNNIPIGKWLQKLSNAGELWKLQEVIDTLMECDRT